MRERNQRREVLREWKKKGMRGREKVFFFFSVDAPYNTFVLLNLRISIFC